MIGKTVLHYRILKELGRGGMGVVYMAEDTKLNRTVALKFLPMYIAKDPIEKERFIREAKATAALNHPNIAAIYELNEFDRQLFIVMEYLEGETLKDRIRREGRLSPQAAIGIAQHIAAGLARAHGKGIIHRDVKSENIMITSDGFVKIMDFGLAKISDASKITQSGETLGTIAYMSPEQVENKKIDRRSDIYSLGIVIYEMLTGRLPFRGETGVATMYSVLHDSPPKLAESGIENADESQELLDRFLAKDPGKRFQKIEDFLSALKNSEFSSLVADSSWRTVEKRRSRKSFTIVFASLALVTLFFSYFYLDEFSKVPNDADLLSTSRTPIAVMYFENMTGNQDLDIWEQGIADLLITDLARHPKLEVLDPQTIYLTQQEHFKDIPRQWNDALALQVASAMDVSVMLFGQIFQKTDQISIRVKLYDIKQKKLLGSDELLLENMASILDKINTLAVKIVSFLEVLQLEKATEYYDRDTDFLAGRTRSINAYKHYIQGMQYFHKFNWNLAVDQLSSAIAYDSTYTAAYFLLGVIYANRGNVTNIHKVLENARKAIAAPTYEEKLMIDAVEAMMERDFHRQVSIFRDLVAFNPGNRGWLYSLGYAYNCLGRYREAIPCFEKVYHSNWKLPYIYYQLGVAYHYTQQYSKESEILKAALKRYPALLGVQTDIIHQYIVRRMVNEAEKAINQALKMAKEGNIPSYWIYSVASWYYMEISDFSSARNLLNNALASQSKDPNLLYSLALVELRAGNIDRFNSLVATVQDTSFESVYSQALLAEKAYHDSKYALACSLYQELYNKKHRRLPPNNSLFHYARSLDETGQDSLAINFYRRSLFTYFYFPGRKEAASHLMALENKLTQK